MDIDAFARAVDPTLLDEKQFVQLVDMLDMLGRAGTGINLAAMRTDTFVWFVSRASAGQLDQLMSHPHLRHVVFDEVFRRMGEHTEPTADARVTMLFMRGKVKVRGDIAFAANLIDYFDLPVST